MQITVAQTDVSPARQPRIFAAQHCLCAGSIEGQSCLDASPPGRWSDLRGLDRLRSNAGKRFRQGIVLYLGDNALPFADRLSAMTS